MCPWDGSSEKDNKHPLALTGALLGLVAAAFATLGFAADAAEDCAKENQAALVTQQVSESPD